MTVTPFLTCEICSSAFKRTQERSRKKVCFSMYFKQGRPCTGLQCFLPLKASYASQHPHTQHLCVLVRGSGRTESKCFSLMSLHVGPTPDPVISITEEASVDGGIRVRSCTLWLDPLGFDPTLSSFVTSTSSLSRAFTCKGGISIQYLPGQVKEQMSFHPSVPSLACCLLLAQPASQMSSNY